MASEPASREKMLGSVGEAREASTGTRSSLLDTCAPVA